MILIIHQEFFMINSIFLPLEDMILIFIIGRRSSFLGERRTNKTKTLSKYLRLHIYSLSLLQYHDMNFNLFKSPYFSKHVHIK